MSRCDATCVQRGGSLKEGGNRLDGGVALAEKLVIMHELVRKL